MAKKINRSTPVVYDPPGFTAEEHEQHFKRDYEFNKRAPQRSPVDGWSYKYINEGAGSYTPPKEVALVKGTPHKFKHVRTANSYARSRPAMKRTPSK